MIPHAFKLMYGAIVAHENSIRKENITMVRSNGNGLVDGCVGISGM